MRRLAEGRVVKSYNHLYPAICSYANLWSAWQKARRGRRSRGYVQEFEHNLERELVQLRKELMETAYVPGPYTEVFIREPKRRMISAAPFRDRVVHHALINVVGPLFERSFIADSYANQENKGVHRAVDRFQEYARRNAYVLQSDIRKYFPSIDHEILKTMIRRTIRCRRTLWLIDRIIDNSNRQEEVVSYFPGDTLFTPIERRRGLPIGNLTSQFFANVYLNGFDHFVREELRPKGYVRYVDDVAVFGNDKAQLSEYRRSISQRLIQLRLDLHEDKSLIHATAGGVPFLGYRVFPEYRLVRYESKQRIRRRLSTLMKRYAEGRVSLSRVRASIHGWLGHVKQAQSYRLCSAILGRAVFVKG